ncbi:unnamed protein product [Pylaiella littoralis]
MSSPPGSPPGTPPSQRGGQPPPVRRSSNRVRRQQTYDCFRDHGAEELSPVQALGKLSAVGLVTTDSQMGAKKQITHYVDGHVLNPPVTIWQRSYISGISAKDLGHKG